MERGWEGVGNAILLHASAQLGATSRAVSYLRGGGGDSGKEGRVERGGGGRRFAGHQAFGQAPETTSDGDREPGRLAPVPVGACHCSRHAIHVVAPPTLN